jgi:uncharacterized membrane protein YuzA (DUF378 family)
MDYNPSSQLWWGLMLRMLGMIILIIAGLNCGSSALFQYNFINELGKPYSTVIYALIGLVALLFMFDRDFYLSFLGRCASPCSSMTLKTPENASLSVSVRVPPNVKVVYWGAEPNDTTVNNPWDAYASYENSGVVLADENGLATLLVRPPANYQVGAFNTTLRKHIHYRYCENNGMMSPIYTVKL